MMRAAIDPIRLLALLSEKARRSWILLLATLPYCTQRPDELASLFKEHIVPFRAEHPAWIQPLFLLSHNPKLLAYALHYGMLTFSHRFVAGNGLPQILSAIHKLSARRIHSNIDILGEAVCSEKEADRYAYAYHSLVSQLGETLPYGTISISFKPSSFYSQTNPCAPEHSAERIATRIEPIMDLLIKYQGHAYLDAEEYRINHIHFLVFEKLYRKYGSAIRTVLQTFLRNSDETLNRLIQLNDPLDPIYVRLVRGAYWYLECFHAGLHSWSVPPVFTKKNETDVQYEELLIRGLNKGLKIIAGTHNVESICYAATCSLGIGIPIYEFQFLHGVGEGIAQTLIQKGWPVRMYMPVGYPRGIITEILPYLIRRIDESQISMIMQAQTSGTDLAHLLARVQEIPERR